MLKITIQNKPIKDHQLQMRAFALEESATTEKEIKNIEKNCCPGLSSLAQQQNFTASSQASVMMPIIKEGGVSYVVVEGLGKKKDKSIDIETYRRAVGRMVRSAQKQKCATLIITIPAASLFKESIEYVVQQTTVIAQMAMYHYDTFFSDTQSKKKHLSELVLIVADEKVEKLKKEVEKASIVGQAVNEARTWVDTPPSNLTPVDLSKKAASIAKKYGLKIQIFDEKKIKAMGMGGLAAVSAGSDLDCQLVVLEYHSGKKNAPTIGFVGKGITFDSGGLSLKPAQYMETMKEDMSGAAAVIASMQAIAQLKPAVNVIGITPLSENLPSGKATKPGDIITFYNGKTAEVRNTDAEGRLILADALAYAVKHYSLDALIDIATLTGACAYALGPFFTGLMSQHDKVINDLKESASRSGDRVWPLPFHDDYKVAIKSSIADICNIGSKKYNAGAITAGFFLQNFVGNTPWAHLDIAGTAFDVPDISYYRSGATGVGVRLLTDFALHWKK